MPFQPKIYPARMKVTITPIKIFGICFPYFCYGIFLLVAKNSGNGSRIRVLIFFLRWSRFQKGGEPHYGDQKNYHKHSFPPECNSEWNSRDDQSFEDAFHFTPHSLSSQIYSTSFFLFFQDQFENLYQKIVLKFSDTAFIFSAEN